MGTTSFKGQTSNSSSLGDKSGGQATKKPIVGLPTHVGSNKLFSCRFMSWAWWKVVDGAECPNGTKKLDLKLVPDDAYIMTAIGHPW